MKKVIFIVSLIFLLLPNICKAQEASFEALGKTGLLKSVLFKGKHYLVCEADPKKYKVETFNQLPNGKGVYTFADIKDQKGDALIFAMNGGMYEKDFSPLGLFIANGKTLKTINLRKDASGNFYLKPNGVFLIDDKNEAFVITSDAFSNDLEAKTATQSGPMLVAGGVYNSAFQEHSVNLNIRNGVGVNKKGNIVFVISTDPVNFYEFAELFKTELGCDNALYLDGVVSQYYAPELQKEPVERIPLGTFLTISRK